MSCRILLAVSVAFSLVGSASAQPPALGPSPRPAYSPYLNIVRPGGSLAQNYYGLVRPEVQARQAIGNLQGAVATNQQAIGNLQAAGTELPGTGFQAQFMNHGSYFLTGGAGAGGAGGRGAGSTNFAGPTRTPQRR